MPIIGGAGVHGKVPARGDFVTRNLPRSFVSPWDEWLQAGIAESQNRLGEPWLSTYLESPMWRFVLASGVCGPESWAGVLMPSVDKVGRYFPLTIAGPLDTTAHPLVTAGGATAWFEAAEGLALRALDDDQLDLEGFVADVAGLGSTPSLAAASMITLVDRLEAGGWCVPIASASAVSVAVAAFLDRLVTDHYPAYTLWWTNGGARATGHCCLLPDLPSADQFCHLLTGSVQAAASAEG